MICVKPYSTTTVWLYCKIITISCFIIYQPRVIKTFEQNGAEKKRKENNFIIYKDTIDFES